MKRGKDSGRISIKRFLLNKFLWIAFAGACQTVYILLGMITHLRDIGEWVLYLHTGLIPLLGAMPFIFLLRGAFVRYREDFLMRYPKAVCFTLIDAAITLILTLYLCLICENSMLGALVLIVTFAAATVSYIIVWIAAFVGFISKK